MEIKFLVLKPEIFFERALKALFKDIPTAYLPSLDQDDDDDDENDAVNVINGSVAEETNGSSSNGDDEDEQTRKNNAKRLNTNSFLTYEEWTNYMIDKV